MAETIKSFERRKREGWFDKYIQYPGIDIGATGDTLKGYVDVIDPTFRVWDLQHGDGDATFMQGIPDGVFKTVYSSHLLEHLENPEEALRNFYRILALGGNLILVVPSAVLYEKQTTLPSRWNGDHKYYYYLDQKELFEATDSSPMQHHIALREFVENILPEAAILEYRILNDGYQSNGDNHPGGEYSLEIICQKPELKVERKRIRKPLGKKK